MSRPIRSTGSGDAGVERALAQLVRQRPAGPGLEEKNGKLSVKVGGKSLRVLQDGTVQIDTAALAAELLQLANVLLLDKRGRIAFSSSAVEAPLSLDVTTGAVQLDIGNALGVVNDQLAVTAAVDPGDSVAAGTVAVLETRYNTLLANLRTAGLIA